MVFQLQKMKVQMNNPVDYWLYDNQNQLHLNELIGKEVVLEFKGEINCVDCGNKTNKSFGQGFCYPCFMKSPQNSECIIRPELCEGHLGKGRDVLWELENHVQQHVVYLALTSEIKVGITRKSNLFNRWIDQGAWKAIVLAETPNRFLAGQIEVALKNLLTDKTNWQKMLKNQMNDHLNLVETKNTAKSYLLDYQQYVSGDDQVYEIKYPVEFYPEKVSSESFDKTPIVSGKLAGIRGQYLIFEGGRVINIRKFSGYVVELFYMESKDENSQKQMSLF